jgi:hypothetical protein
MSTPAVPGLELFIGSDIFMRDVAHLPRPVVSASFAPAKGIKPGKVAHH